MLRLAVRTKLLGYPLAIVLVSVAVLAGMILPQQLYIRNVHGFFYFAVLLAAWYGGIGPGLLAAVLSVWAIDDFFEPTFLNKLGSEDLFNSAMFALMAVLVAALDWMRRRALAAMKRSEARWRRIVESDLIGIFFANGAGDITDANDAFLRLLGYARAEIGNGSMRTFDLTAPEYRASNDQANREMFYGGACRTHERDLLRKDGTRVPVLFGAAMLDAGKRDTVGFVLDITHRRRFEQQLKAAKENAEAANLSKDQFLAVLSHELRTPLTPALAAASAMQFSPEMPQDLRSDIEMICRNIDLEARLIDDLLDLTRISRGKMQLALAPIDAHALLKQVVEICAPDADAKGIRMTVELRATQRFVNGDSARLQQVFWNLVKNAIKFTPEGGDIVVSSRDQVLKAHLLVISVQDTGLGIEPQVLPRIFNAFEQGEQTITRRFGGLGLGLAITRALVEAHQGAISALSEGKDRGATFEVRLPTIPEPAVLESVPAAPDTLDGNAARQRLLLVEDHEDTSRILSRLLQGSGYSVVTAHTVAGALKAAERHEVDLVISDLGLPDGTGLELMSKLRETYQVPGIALSGYGMEADIRKSREAGFVAHLTKPVNIQTLQQTIRQIVARREEMAR